MKKIPLLLLAVAALTSAATTSSIAFTPVSFNGEYNAQIVSWVEDAKGTCVYTPNRWAAKTGYFREAFPKWVSKNSAYVVDGTSSATLRVSAANDYGKLVSTWGGLGGKTSATPGVALPDGEYVFCVQFGENGGSSPAGTYRRFAFTKYEGGTVTKSTPAADTYFKDLTVTYSIKGTGIAPTTGMSSASLKPTIATSGDRISLTFKGSVGTGYASLVDLSGRTLAGGPITGASGFIPRVAPGLYVMNISSTVGSQSLTVMVP